VPAEDATAHAAALAHLLTHPDEAQAMGARGRRAVEARYSWEAESTKLLDLYATLVTKRE
jgi:glycosyltransferase involved in cell wall biosynthesis